MRLLNLQARWVIFISDVMKNWTYRRSHEKRDAIWVSVLLRFIITLAGRHVDVCTQDRRCHPQVATSPLPEADSEADSPSTFTLAVAIRMFSKSVYLQLQVIRALCKIHSKLLCLIKTSQPMPLGYSSCTYLLLKKAVRQYCVLSIFSGCQSPLYSTYCSSTVKVNFALQYKCAFSSTVSDWMMTNSVFNYISSSEME